MLSASQDDNKIAWYENVDGAGTFGPQRVISLNAYGASDVFAADLDGDDDLDVLSASRDESRFTWYENVDAAGTFGPRHIFAQGNYATRVIAADMDDDGDMDAIVGSSDAFNIAWYENTDGAGTFGTQHVVNEDGWVISDIAVADVDGDGDPDLLSTEGLPALVAWYENTDGAGTFGPQRVIAQYAYGINSVFAADLDDDGDMDVLAASRSSDKVAWYANTDGAETFGPQRVVTSPGATSANTVVAADVDGDGDADVISASGGDAPLAWYENTDELGTFGPHRSIAQGINFAEFVVAADLDGDGDVDVISASYNSVLRGYEVYWCANTDGAGTFGPQRVITLDADSVSSVVAADLDRDGDLDVLLAAELDNNIAWYDNLDGTGTFGPQRVITLDADRAQSVFAVDVDGDKDLDVVTASGGDSKIAWYENLDGAGTFGPQRLINLDPGDWPTSAFAADLDGDGDMDVLTASGEGDKIAWYENTDGAGTFGPQRVITLDADGATSVYTADLDGDGDLDVLSASFSDNKIAWYENIDGVGTFGPQRVITLDADGARSVFASDLDGDGDTDVLSASWGDDKIAWYENLLAHPGDANRDGRFDTADLIQVLSAGEYEDNIAGNSTWEEGDWNDDGDFDSTDLVVALATGNYERQSRAMTAAIAAAVDSLFADDESPKSKKALVA